MTKRKKLLRGAYIPPGFDPYTRDYHTRHALTDRKMRNIGIFCNVLTAVIVAATMALVLF